MKRDQRPEELIARALCRHAGNPENATHKRAPLWATYLPEAKAVLKALEDEGFHVLGRDMKM